MADWKNLDELTAYKELEKVSPVDLKTVMAGESGADRVKNCSIPMAEGLSYNYAAKAVDNRITEQLEKLKADKAFLFGAASEKSDTGMSAQLGEQHNTSPTGGSGEVTLGSALKEHYNV